MEIGRKVKSGPKKDEKVLEVVPTLVCILVGTIVFIFSISEFAWDHGSGLRSSCSDLTGDQLVVCTQL